MSQDPTSRPSFDAFGERADALLPETSERGDRLARRVGAAIFWTLAALILYGRVTVGVPTGSPALLLAHMAAASQTVLQ